MPGKRHRDSDTPPSAAMMRHREAAISAFRDRTRSPSPRPDENAMDIGDESSDSGLPSIKVPDSAADELGGELEAMTSEAVPPGTVPVRRGSDSSLYKEHSSLLEIRTTRRPRYSVQGDAGLNLEGQHIAETARQNGEQNFSFGSVAPRELLAALQKNLEPVDPSFFPRRREYFLPWTRLHRWLSTETVLQLLKHLNDVAESGAQLLDNDLEAMARIIAPPQASLGSGDGVNGQYRRTLATLILVNQAPMMFEFYGAGMNDKELLDMPFNNLEPNNSRFNDLFRGWTPKEIKDFERYRWQLTPTFLSDSWLQDDKEINNVDDGERSEAVATRVRYTLRSTEELLPLGDHGIAEMSGGYGSVRIFKPHKDQQSLLRYTVSIFLSSPGEKPKVPR